MMKLYTLTKPNSVSMALLLPQFITITVAEIFFSVTGYGFCYSQVIIFLSLYVISYYLTISVLDSNLNNFLCK